MQKNRFNILSYLLVTRFFSFMPIINFFRHTLQSEINKRQTTKPNKVTIGKHKERSHT